MTQTNQLDMVALATAVAQAVSQANAQATEKPDALKEFERMQANGDEQEFSDVDVIRNPLTGRIVRGPDGAFDRTSVTFSSEAVYSKRLTVASGTPTYVDVDHITIMVPGDLTTVIHSPATEYHKWLYPHEWSAHINGQALALTGTPLGLWPVLTKSQVKDLEHKGIRTVEQIADMSDSNATQFAGFHKLKGQAQAFLDTKRRSDAATTLQAELDERDQRHQLEMDVLKEQVRQLMAAQAPAKAAKPARE